MHNLSWNSCSFDCTRWLLGFKSGICLHTLIKDRGTSLTNPLKKHDFLLNPEVDQQCFSLAVRFCFLWNPSKRELEAISATILWKFPHNDVLTEKSLCTLLTSRQTELSLKSMRNGCFRMFIILRNILFSLYSSFNHLWSPTLSHDVQYVYKCFYNNTILNNVYCGKMNPLVTFLFFCCGVHIGFSRDLPQCETCNIYLTKTWIQFL